VSVAKDLREKEPGTIGNKNAQIFANVFIGRAKPWVTQLPLAELKPAEADLLVQVALLAAFSVPHPPATQLSLLKWGAEGGRLSRLAEPALATIIKAMERWNGKWRGVLKREVAELPEQIVQALKLDAAPPPEQPRSEPKSRVRTEERPERDSPESDEAAESASAEKAERDEEDDEEDEDDEDGDEDEEKPAAPPQARQRPVYESKTVPSRGGRPGDGGRGGDSRPFNLPESLRQIEQYVNGLRSELTQAQNRLRQREDEGRRRRDQPVERAAPIAGAPTPDELARLNQQLEARNTELQARIDEMREDAEMRAASGAVPAETGATDPAEHLRSLLVLKLQDDFADFLALEQEAPDLVIKRHYPVLLRHVFEVLRLEGVKLQEPPPEGAA
jgi:hypothetical protein